jgi:hypothetical protein
MAEKAAALGCGNPPDNSARCLFEAELIDLNHRIAAYATMIEFRIGQRATLIMATAGM